MFKLTTFNTVNVKLKMLKVTGLFSAITQNARAQINGVLGGVDELVRISKGGGNVRPVKYQNETSYTFPGGNNYRETVFVLDEPIIGNKKSMQNLGKLTQN